MEEKNEAMQRLNIGNALFVFKLGDLTAEDSDAIVNATNSALAGGGGVDGAIHRAGGPSIVEECRRIVAARGRCPAGCAVITSGGRLRARYVIHAVGPVWSGGTRGEADLLRDAYLSALNLAASHRLESIAFPSISTGAYRYPIEEAAQVALRAVCLWAEKHQRPNEIRFVLFSARDFEVYRRAAAELCGGERGA